MSYTMLNNRLKAHGYGKSTLAGAALDFIRESCQGLRFEETDESSGYKGKSLKAAQIPFNMEKDVDRLCLENAVARFLKSGSKADAFDVYFCYLDMFVGDYDKTRRMIELLSEFEANGSGLLMKHRDHYSHSVYVFCLGLAIYQTNAFYRKTYKKFYKLTDRYKAAYHYLQYWGLASLFHDIGYPFELPFEQVASYFEVAGDQRKDRPYVAYNALDSFVSINNTTRRNLGRELNLGTDRIFGTTDEVFAYELHRKLGNIYYFSEEEMLENLRNKPSAPNKFGYFMDHAYFSATVLFRKLFEEIKVDFRSKWSITTTLDSLTAILLHNSLYKFNVAYYKDPDANIRLKAQWHPIAFMLMLCDELQCWDRTAYGRNSKLELYPMDCRFDFSSGTINAHYVFDKAEEAKIEKYKAEKETNPKAKLKSYSSYDNYETIVRDNGVNAKVNAFQSDIEKIVDLSDMSLSVDVSVESSSEKQKNYLSDSKFISLYDFAIVLNGMWSVPKEWKENKTATLVKFLSDDKKVRELQKKFGELSLEYKLSNIGQAKAFDKYMNAIGCFFTDRPVDFEMVEKFSEEELQTIGPMEHRRWLQEHYDMGWIHGEPEKTERDLKRCHKDMIPGFAGGPVTEEASKTNYDRLCKAEQDKDTDPMEYMLTMLKLFDGIRIYRL